MINKILTIVAIIMFGIVSVASAVVIDFEDLNGTHPNGWSHSIDSPYYGLNFTNCAILNANTSTPVSGWQNAATSGSNAMYNRYTNPTTIDSLTPFTFNSAYYTGIQMDNMNVTVNGYLNGIQIHSIEFLVNTQTPYLAIFDWESIDTIITATSGGTYHYGNSKYLAIDDITYNESTNSSSAPVPEPATCLLMGCGLLSLAGYKKFKKV